MEPILDADPRPIRTQSNLFSKIALMVALVAMVLLILVFKNVGNILSQEMSYMDFQSLLIAYIVATILGSGFSIIAVIRGEPASRVRTLALFLNIFLFFFLIGIFFFGNA